MPLTAFIIAMANAPEVVCIFFTTSSIMKHVSKITLPLFILLFAALGFAASAQTLTGLVQDTAGFPLPGAAVMINNSQTGVSTSANGTYFIRLKPGTYSLRASFVGYQPLVQSIDITTENTVQQPAVLNFVLSPQNNVTEEVIIGGLRVAEQDPVAQTNISKQEIEQVFNGQDAAFVLERTAPSIMSYSEAGTGFSNYGGLRMRGIDQTRINMTLNGVPLNDMIDQGVFFSNFTDFANSLQSVQVQRGVGANTNGTASYGGSINFEAINLNDSVPSASLQLGGGSFGTIRGSAEVKTGLMENNTAFYGRMTNFHSDGYRYNTRSRSSSLFFSGGYFGKKDLIKVTAFSGRTRSRLGYFAVPLELIEQDRRTNVNFIDDNDDFGQQLVITEYTRLINPRTSITVSPYVGGAGGDFISAYPTTQINFDTTLIFPDTTIALGNADTSVGKVVENYPLYNQHYGILAQISRSSADRKVNIDGGIHAYTFRRINEVSNITDDRNPYYRERSQKDEVSAFAKVTYQLGAVRLFGNVQARYVELGLTPDDRFATESVADRDWFFLNPTVGATYELNPNLSVYASAGRTGREPTRFDLLSGSFFFTDNNINQFEDEDFIKPEYVNDFEGGIRWQNKAVSIDLNAFYMLFEDEITAIGQNDSFGFSQVRKNVDESYRRGIEIQAQWKALPQWTLSGHATFMQANVSSFTTRDTVEVTVTDVMPVLTPNTMGQLTVEYKPRRNISFFVTGRGASEMYIDLENTEALKTPAYFVFDAGASWTFYKNHRLSVFGYNLTDQLYFTNGVIDSDGNPGYFVQPPVSFQVMLEARF